MAEAAFEQTVWIAAPAETVTRALGGFRDHGAIHPFIVRVRRLDSLAAPDGGPLDRYSITDRVPLGPFRLPATYLATIWRSADDTLTSDAYQFPRVHLHNVTRCREEGQGTRVEEVVTIYAPSLLSGYVRRQAFAAHKAMLANLKQHLERQTAYHDQ